METSAIFALLDAIPVWVWVVGVIGILIATGDKSLWDYEVKFPLKEGVGRGEVEIEEKKRNGTSIECTFELEQIYQHKAIDIFLNDKEIYTVPATKNNSSRIRITQKIPIAEPKEGDQVCVRIEGEEIFSGPLVLD